MLLLVVEVALHLVFEYSNNPRVQVYASFNQLERNSGLPQYSPHRYLGYYPTPNWERGKNAHNSLAFRGDEIRDTQQEPIFRIVCIGGSTTYTTEVEDYRKSYPDLLEQMLVGIGIKNVEVINSGVGNWSTWESFINFQQRVLDLEPDLLVIYHSTNDIQPRIVWPPEEYVGDNKGRRSSTFEGLSPSWREVLFERSNILRIISIKAGLKTPNTVLERLDPSPPTYYLPEFIRQLNEDIYPSGIFEKVPVSKMLEANQPIYFERNLNSIIDLAQANDIGVVISTFAHCTKFEKEFSSTPEYSLAYSQHNEVIQRIAGQQEIPCLDFANLFPGDVEYFADGRHVNEKGASLKAKIFADFISQSLRENPSLFKQAFE